MPQLQSAHITTPEGLAPGTFLLQVEILTDDPAALLLGIQTWTRRAAPARDPLADATRPAGTPASDARRAIEDSAAQVGGTVVHAAQGVPTIVPAGDEPEGVDAPAPTPTPATPAKPPRQRKQPPPSPTASADAVTPSPAPASAPTPTELPLPAVKPGDEIEFATLELAEGVEIPDDLMALAEDAGGKLPIQKAARRAGYMAVVLEGGWMAKLVVGSAEGTLGVTEFAAPGTAPTPTARRTKAAAPESTGDAALDSSMAVAHTVLDRLKAMAALKDVLQALRDAGVPDEHFVPVCTAIKDKVPVIKRCPSLEDRIPRLVLILGTAAA